MNLYIYIRSLWDELILSSLLNYWKKLSVLRLTQQSSLSSLFLFPQTSLSFYILTYPFLFLPIPILLLYAYHAADTMLNTGNKMLNNLEVDMTCIFNQEPVKIALTFCALGTCKIDQKGAVEVEGKVIL